MRRREFMLVGAAAAAWPLGAHAQQGDRMRCLGILMVGAESDPQYQTDVAVFREGLQKLGWVDGQNIRIEVRWAGFNAETLRRCCNKREPFPLFSRLLPIRSAAASWRASRGQAATPPVLQCTKPLSAASG